jgi:hypothetical protein
LNEYGRIRDILHPHRDDLYHLAPVPVYYREFDDAELEDLNRQLIEIAKQALPEPIREVPDARHAHTLGSVPTFKDASWSETQTTPVGVWHRVPVNQFLDLPEGPVTRLRSVVEDAYRSAIAITEQCDDTEPWITESWIQFYKDGDYKVLHNHERYGPPYPDRRWVGAYYVDDGAPDSTMPYSGVFSFSVRRVKYFIRPRAGLLMLWPADILHEVHPFYGERQRIVVNFNINSR